MNVPFNQQEMIAIQQLAQMMDLPPERVVVQALRMFQLWKMGKINLTFPTVIPEKLYEEATTIADLSTDGTGTVTA